MVGNEVGAQLLERIRGCIRVLQQLQILPGKMTSAFARYANQNLRMKK